MPCEGRRIFFSRAASQSESVRELHGEQNIGSRTRSPKQKNHFKPPETMFKKIVTKKIAFILLPFLSLGFASCKDSTGISWDFQENGKARKSAYEALESEFGDSDFASDFMAGFEEGFNETYNHEMPNYGHNGWTGGQDYGYGNGYGYGYGNGYDIEFEEPDYTAKPQRPKTTPKETTSKAPRKKGLLNVLSEIRVPRF